MGEIRDLNYKIKRRNSLISTIKEESEELEKEILSNEEEIKSQQLLLEELKQDYAKIVYNSYKSKSKLPMILFRLTNDFNTSNNIRILEKNKRIKYKLKQTKSV